MFFSSVQVHVVDSGKSKEKTYDWANESTALKTCDISQACATQRAGRAGRAGRVRSGSCYRLFTTGKYESMNRFKTPDMLRISLHETCLKAKMFAGNSTITNFLQRALEPPADERIIHNIQHLQKNGALDMDENVTPLGAHLTRMPVDCEYGKMLLYAILLRCIDPVVTIVSILSAKEPFQLTNNNGNHGDINDINTEFSENSLSDHKLLMNIFQSWFKSSNCGGTEHERFCESNLLSNAKMEMIKGMKQLIMRHVYYFQQRGENCFRKTL